METVNTRLRLGGLLACAALHLGAAPVRMLGCEVWRDLDWLVDADKVALDAGRRLELAAELLKVPDSQIAGGKRYDLITPGRRLARTTYRTSHATDRLSGITWAMELPPLIANPALSLAVFVQSFVSRLQEDIIRRINQVSGGIRNGLGGLRRSQITSPLLRNREHQAPRGPRLPHADHPKVSDGFRS